MSKICFRHIHIAVRLCTRFLLKLTQHLTSLLDDILAFPAHANNGSRAKEFDKSSKERLGAQVGVVTGGHFFRRPDHLEANKFVATLFETRNNIANQTTLDTVGLYSQKGALLVSAGLSIDRESLAQGGAAVITVHRPQSHRTCDRRRGQGGTRPGS